MKRKENNRLKMNSIRWSRYLPPSDRRGEYQHPPRNNRMSRNWTDNSPYISDNKYLLRNDQCKSKTGNPLIRTCRIYLHHQGSLMRV